ncbi:MAG: class I SAM-dependent methyltransferase [Betaproteobacteria bacterium]|nr:MAG: class I SAM-dependent methyltransferase [Betaproteobacteria bacterium]
MTLPQQHTGLPLPPPDALEVSAHLHALIDSEIIAAGGWISFARYMELALYAPGLGYYSAGSRKLGPAGDFVTAPELSPLFGRTLARQLAELIRQGLADILELGAGSGALAVAALTELAALDCLPQRYLILEVSADLRERQQSHLVQTVPRLADRVHWLEMLPDRLNGVVIGNEVLDAIPVHRIRTDKGALLEIGVRVSNNEFASALRPASGALAQAAHQLSLPDDYETEIGPAASALIADLGRRLERGVLLFIDYGFPAHEFYHPQRNRGTLMCHYRHHAHADPFLWPGLQDITAHVDFSAIALAGTGLDLLGYANQAQFLINCGITELLAAVPATETARYAPLAAQAQKLLSPAEMGELFKVIALGRGIDPPLLGFRRGDKSHTL